MIQPTGSKLWRVNYRFAGKQKTLALGAYPEIGLAAEIDMAAALWTIPGCKMKMGADHLIPLSRQALAILAEIKPLSGGGRYAFPGERGKTGLCRKTL